jgi:tripartite-type tricarboxylate transporter receptor subunit TctC
VSCAGPGYLASAPYLAEHKTKASPNDAPESGGFIVRIKAVHVALLAIMAGCSAITSGAHAQAWPQKQVTFIVPFAAGGGTDAFARPLAAQLDTQLGKRVIIENRAGAGGTVGASAAAKAAPDGYTFFMGAAHHAIAPSLYPNLDYDIEKDFVPVALIARPPQVIVVNPDKVAAKTLGEFIAYAKANPDKLSYGSAGAGTTHHLAGELFKILTQTKIQHVPYRGAGPAMQDLIAGHVPVVFDGLRSAWRPSLICRRQLKPVCRIMKSPPGMGCLHPRARRPTSSSAWRRN